MRAGGGAARVLRAPTLTTQNPLPHSPALQAVAKSDGKAWLEAAAKSDSGTEEVRERG